MKSVLAILLLVLFLLQLRLWTGAGSMAEIFRLEDEIAEQTEDNAKLEGRNSSLMEEVGDLRNGLDSIEERARNELGLIRQGETFYLIVEEEGKATRQAESPIESTAPAPEPLIEEVAPEPPPEIAEEDNPYLDIFRDGEETPEQSSAANEQGAKTALPASQ